MAPASNSRFRRLLLASAALVVALAVAGAANAAPVRRQAELKLTIDILTVPDEVARSWHPVITLTSTGATVTVDSATGSLLIPAGALSQTAPITVPLSSTTVVYSLRATGIRNLSGLLNLGGGAVTSPTTELPCPTAMPIGIACVTAGGANLGGQMGLSGTLFVKMAFGTISIPLAAGNVGVGGVARVPNTPYGFLFDAAPWTQGVGKSRFTATSMTTWWGASMYEVHTMSWLTTATTAGAGGTANAPASGTITLVTPTYLGLGPGERFLPTFLRLEIHFVPEPGAAVMLAAGLAGLAAAGRRRSRR